MNHKNRVLAFLSLFFFCSLKVFSQEGLYYFQPAKTWELGGRVGFTTSIINSKGEPDLERGVKLGLTGGVFARYQWAEQWALHTDLGYSIRGNKSESGNFENGYIDFAVTPVRNVKYKMFGNEMTFDFFLGPGISFLTSAVDKDNLAIDMQQLLPSTELNIVIGGGLPLGPILLTATSRVGMTNLFRKVVNDSPWFSFSTEWTAAYRFR